ncbi:MAG: hypothetical protein P8X63_02330 [Desulfuromonadaceae bacterium]
MVSDDRNITPEKCKDSGLALVLICLIIHQIWKPPYLVPLAIGFLLLVMIHPPLFKPFARLWFGLSIALGTVLSKIILTLLFFLLVLPVGLLRRALGRDSLQLKGWRQGTGSVFQIRDHSFTPQDLEHPY